MTPTTTEARIGEEALAYARTHKKVVAKRLTTPTIYLPEEDPVSVFMAGSPGAGKTEASIELLKEIGDTPILRIDPDELRSEFPAYTGANAWLFQKAVPVLVDSIHDMALEQRQSFLLDGTLSRYEVALRNINRSLKRKRTVQIRLLFQTVPACRPPRAGPCRQGGRALRAARGWRRPRHSAGRLWHSAEQKTAPMFAIAPICAITS